jgi:hypothetical protein
MLFLVASLLLSSGCALFLVGAGGAGGYLIRKGEEGDSPKKNESPAPANKSSSRQQGELQLAAVSGGPWVVMRPGDTQ